jgi:hypothetical protein
MIPDGIASLEYKYIITRNDSKSDVIWEDGPNRKVKIQDKCTIVDV